jgi:hypothetical protein
MEVALNRKISFKTISYTSTLLWHFVRGAGDNFDQKAENSLSLFLTSESGTEILQENGKGYLRRIPPKRDSYHNRTFTLEGALPASAKEDDFGIAKDYFVKELRSLCFADIPINHLPIHLDRYYGIGLGFRRDIISSKIEDLKPVEYYPRKTIFTLENSCEVFFGDTSHPLTLKRYAKIPSMDESFDDIYNEREWRTFQDLEFSEEELAMIFFPTRKILNRALNEARFKSLFAKGVGYICGEDLYESSKEKTI